MRYVMLAVLALSCSCGRNALHHATAPDEKKQGIRVEVEGGIAAGTAGIRLENVGSYTVIPIGWKGPIPPGWTSPDSPPTSEEGEDSVAGDGN